MKKKKNFKKEKVNKIVYFMKKDKKNVSDKINLILLKKIGKASKPLSVNVNEIKRFLYSYYN